MYVSGGVSKEKNAVFSSFSILIKSIILSIFSRYFTALQTIIPYPLC